MLYLLILELTLFKFIEDTMIFYEMYGKSF